MPPDFSFSAASKRMGFVNKTNKKRSKEHPQTEHFVQLTKLGYENGEFTPQNPKFTTDKKRFISYLLKSKFPKLFGIVEYKDGYNHVSTMRYSKSLRNYGSFEFFGMTKNQLDGGHCILIRYISSVVYINLDSKS
jgi:hypothetical protein